MRDSEDPTFARLRDALEAGELTSGGKLLPERLLSARLSIGRHALRQSLARLEAHGTIWRRQGKGTFLSSVQPPSEKTFLADASATSPAEMMDVRIEFEPILARICAMRASRDQVSHIRRTAALAASTDNSRDFETADLAFHRSVAAGSNNVLFIAMFELAFATLQQADWRAARRRHAPPERRAQVAGEHSAIFEAITARDPRAAESAMRRHLRSVYDNLQQP